VVTVHPLHESDISFVHIADTTAEPVRAQGLQTVGLLATPKRLQNAEDEQEDDREDRRDQQRAEAAEAVGEEEEHGGPP
jgi:hypothetical protein